MATNNYRIGILTLSDKGSRGERVDESGRLVADMLAGLGEVARYQIIPDDMNTIIMMLETWTDDLQLDLILTTGGTGLGPRDCTPQATATVLDYQVPGMAEAMRSESLKITPRAMISRALAGVRNQTLIINLPGSAKSARENLYVLLPALPHALSKLKGDLSDCAATE